MIAQGARLIQGVDDVIEDVIHQMPKELPLEIQAPEPQIKKGAEVTNSQRVLVEENLSPVLVGVDELARQCQICAEELLCIILELELAGKVTRCAGNKVALAIN